MSDSKLKSTDTKEIFTEGRIAGIEDTLYFLFNNSILSGTSYDFLKLKDEIKSSCNIK